MTPQEATDALGELLSKYDGYWYLTHDTAHHNQLLESVREYLECGADIHKKCSAQYESPLFMALKQLHSSSVIYELIKNGYDTNHLLSYIDYVWDDEMNREHVIPRYYTIPNCLVIMDRLIRNDKTIQHNLIKKYKEQMGWNMNTIFHHQIKPYRNDVKSGYDSSDDEIYEEELQPIRDNESVLHFINTHLDEYCILFTIDRNDLVYLEEVIPDDLTNKYIT